MRRTQGHTGRTRHPATTAIQPVAAMDTRRMVPTTIQIMGRTAIRPTVAIMEAGIMAVATGEAIGAEAIRAAGIGEVEVIEAAGEIGEVEVIADFGTVAHHRA